MNHPENEFLNSYLDGELADAVRLEVDSHLRACSDCREELSGLQRVKTGLRAMPRRTLPSAVIAALEEKAAERLEKASWLWRLVYPKVWVPAAAFALATLTLVFWFLRVPAIKDGIPVEALLAAHDRYLDEAALPPADLASGSFSGKLASFQETVE